MYAHVFVTWYVCDGVCVCVRARLFHESSASSVIASFVEYDLFLSFSTSTGSRFDVIITYEIARFIY